MRSNRNDLFLSVAGLIIYIPAVGRYGLKLEVLLVLSLFIGIGVELLAGRLRGERTQTLGWPVWIILPLVLPPALPLWMVGVTCLFTAVITVVFFGGYGRHMVSPVAFGWAFAAMSFPTAFGFGWSYPFPSAWHGFRHWSAALSLVDHPLAFLSAQSGVTTATILSGNFPQPPGNALPALLLLLGVVLLLLRSISFRVCLGFIGTTLILSLAFPGLASAPVFDTILVGDTFLVAFLVLPDMRTSSRTLQGRWLVGAAAGLVAFLIRHFATVADGAFFAVLFVAVFTPLIDEIFIKVRRVSGVDVKEPAA